jgi:predicted kinase
MKSLILTIGLPRSGKSTWANKQNCPVINRDQIRMVYHGNAYIEELESDITIIENYLVREVFMNNDKVIIDATHMTKKRRIAWDQKDNVWDEVHLKIFPVTKIECIRRATNDNKSYLIPVIERMYEETDVDEIRNAG